MAPSDNHGIPSFRGIVAAAALVCMSAVLVHSAPTIPPSTVVNASGSSSSTHEACVVGCNIGCAPAALIDPELARECIQKCVATCPAATAANQGGRRSDGITTSATAVEGEGSTERELCIVGCELGCSYAAIVGMYQQCMDKCVATCPADATVQVARRDSGTSGAPEVESSGSTHDACVFGCELGCSVAKIVGMYQQCMDKCVATCPADAVVEVIRRDSTGAVPEVESSGSTHDACVFGCELGCSVAKIIGMYQQCVDKCVATCPADATVQVARRDSGTSGAPEVESSGSTHDACVFGCELGCPIAQIVGMYQQCVDKCVATCPQ